MNFSLKMIKKNNNVNFQVLHLSQPVFISNSAVEAIVNMRQLQELSLIASPDLKFQEGAFWKFLQFW